MQNEALLETPPAQCIKIFLLAYLCKLSHFTAYGISDIMLSLQVSIIFITFLSGFNVL